MQFTAVMPIEKRDADGGVQRTATLPSTRSCAETVKVTTGLFVVMSGDSVSEGGVVSTTVIVNVPVVEAPCASVAVQETVVVPRGKSEPDAGVQANEVIAPISPGEPGSAPASYFTSAPCGPVASAVIGAGSLRMGCGCASTIVTRNSP